MSEYNTVSVKGVLYLGAIPQGEKINKSKCFILQEYEYECKKNLGIDNVPGNENFGEWKVCVKSLPEGGMKEFYAQFLDQRNLYNYTFFFDTNFDTFGNLNNFGSATVLEGRISSIEEAFDTYLENHGVVDRMCMYLTFQVKNVRFVGNDEIISKELSL